VLHLKEPSEVSGGKRNGSHARAGFPSNDTGEDRAESPIDEEYHSFGYLGLAE